MDNLHKTEEPPGELLPPLPASHPRHYLAGQSHQYCCAGVSWILQHTHPPLSAQAVLAQPRASHGRWPHPKRCTVWGAGNRTPSRRPSGTASKTGCWSYKRQRRKERQESLDSNQPSTFRCTTCDRDCHSRIRLVSHARRCAKQT